MDPINPFAAMGTSNNPASPQPPDDSTDAVAKRAAKKRENDSQLADLGQNFRSLLQRNLKGDAQNDQALTADQSVPQIDDDDLNHSASPDRDASPDPDTRLDAGDGNSSSSGAARSGSGGAGQRTSEQTAATGTSEPEAVSDLPEEPGRDDRDQRSQPSTEGPVVVTSPAPAFPVSGADILQSIQPTEQSPPVASSTAEKIAAVAEQVAERILVSDPTQSGAQEVRVFLKDDVLPQTEVRISRQDGEVRIEFVTQSESSYALLAERQSDVQSRLSERLDRQAVAVTLTRGSRDQGQSRNRRD